MEKREKLCPICQKIGRLTAHHIYPRRYYGDTGPLFYLCELCHRKLERKITEAEQLPKEAYQNVLKKFIEESSHGREKEIIAEFTGKERETHRRTKRFRKTKTRELLQYKRD